MRRLLCGLALLACSSVWAQQITIPPPNLASPGPIGQTTPAAGSFTTLSVPLLVINVTDPAYGAKCDGTTDDDVSINAALTAAFNSTAYQNNNLVTVKGPVGTNQAGCKMHSLNFTQFNKGTGANPKAAVTLETINLRCSKGSSNGICLDGLGGDHITVASTVTVRGDNVDPPEICFQVGVVAGISAAWNAFNGSCDNEFAFTDIYNFGSENFTMYGAKLDNVHTSSGPIVTLGSITGGSAYTNGTYTGVALTGGAGSGALATIVVSGNAVTSVTLSYEGRDYAPSDTLSASAANIGGTGSGFSITVSTTGIRTIVEDGQNHWRASSAFVTETLPVDTWQSLTLNDFIDINTRGIGAGAPIWIASTGGLHISGYVLNSGTTGTACIDSYNNGVGHSGVPVGNWGLDLDLNCEQSPGPLTALFHITGSNATQLFQDFRWRGYHQGTETFLTDANITSVTMQNADIDLKFANNASIPMFSTASVWNMAGQVYVPAAGNWNAPGTFNGRLLVGSVASLYGQTLNFLGNISGAGIFSGSQGYFINQALALDTDTTISGTTTSVYSSYLKQRTLTSSGSATISNLYALNIDPPTCSAPLTCTTIGSLRLGGRLQVSGLISGVAGATISGGNTTINGGAIVFGDSTHAPVVSTGYTIAGSGAGTLAGIASPTAGMRAYVTDQLTTCAVAGAVLTGGGSAKCPVFYNGSAWVGD